jgi:BolA family transcriptional regulator, general stress-responsive regulator
MAGCGRAPLCPGSAVSERRIRLIKERLDAALAPSRCQIFDESHLHAGHAGARDGRGHFRIVIASPQFQGLSRIQQHRLVYEALGDLLQTDIHAVGLDIQPQ